jgi:molecular chaperone HscA
MELLEIFDPKAPARAIGIDLGTTHSLIAYVKDDAPQIISDCNGVSLLPSVVHYTKEGGVSVGVVAKALAATAAKETIASVKRLMGRGADDPETKRPSPYEFAAPTVGAPNVVRMRVHQKLVTPVEVSAEILRALKRLAEDELHRVGGAVITVPAYFDDAQRQATKDAGRLAGLEVLRLLSEPTAAALAYGLEKKKNGTFAVFDLGGGTFDITILILEDGVFQVKATGGDSALGGDDMDRILGEMLAAKFGLKPEVVAKPEVIRVLLDLAREVKHRLTTEKETKVANVFVEPSAASGATVTRVEFEQAIAPLLAKLEQACKRAVRDADVKTSQLSGVIMVGGSTRVPAVHACAKAVFGQEPLCDLDPDRVVALGAALQANMLSGQTSDVLLLDVTPLSLGIEVGGGTVDRILPRNSSIPAKAHATYTTQKDNQTGFSLRVVQGERDLAKDCRSLAEFTLRGIPPLPAGLARLEVTFDVDADGILAVHTREILTGIEQTVEVVPSYGLDDDAIEQMLIDAMDNGEADIAARKLAELRMDAERIHLATFNAVQGTSDVQLLPDDERARIVAALAELENESKVGSAPGPLRLAIDRVDQATQAFAARRMNHAIATALAGKDLSAVEHKVEGALGIDEAHARGGVRTFDPKQA